MSKNKKGKVVPIKQAYLSAEKYIKTQARSLPIAECWVSEDWQNTGICNIIVARRHKNGNYTAGVYLVDLYCLGVKDTTYHFNLDPDGYEFLKENCGDIEECEYVLAHNIIYGAIEFAEDYGFKPDKDFDIARYILEEDDENVVLMDIDFGFEGVPFYVKGPNDNDAKVQSIKNTLMRTAGEGNFSVIEDVDDFDLEELDEEFDEDDWYMDDEENDDDLPEEQREALEDVLRVLKPVKKVYDKAIRTDGGREMLKNSTIGKGYRLTKKPVKTDYDTFKEAGEEELYNQLRQLFDEGEYKTAIERLKEVVARYPNNPMFYNLLQGCYLFSGEFDKSDKLTAEMFEKFPDYIFAMVPYANMLIDEGKLERALAAFRGQADLDELYPGQKQFNRHEAAIYYAVMCRYFLAAGDIDAADLYMDAILKKDLQYVPHQTLVNKALMELCDAKVEKIKIKIGWNE